MAKTTSGALPPITSKDPIRAQGRKLVAVTDLPAGGVVEVATDAHGTLAVGLSDGEPFATSNVCRHQFAKLGRGWVDADGRLVCPWHRAAYDVATGEMVHGPQGKVFGFAPFSATVKAAANAVKCLDSHPVEMRAGAIWLTA